MRPQASFGEAYVGRIYTRVERVLQSKDVIYDAVGCVVDVSVTFHVTGFFDLRRTQADADFVGISDYSVQWIRPMFLTRYTKNIDSWAIEIFPVV